MLYVAVWINFEDRMLHVASRVNLKGAKTRGAVTVHMFRKLLSFLQVWVIVLRDENWAGFSIWIASPSDKNLLAKPCSALWWLQVTGPSLFYFFVCLFSCILLSI